MPETKQPTQRKRRWKRFLTGAVGVLLLLLIVYPLWFPWVLKPVAAAIGVQFESCHRHGYARIELLNVHWQNESVSISAERVDLHMPHRWISARLSMADITGPQVIVQNWRMEVSPPKQPSNRGRGSTAQLLDNVQSEVPSLSRWVRSVVLTNGEVELQSRHFAIPAVRWQGQQLNVDALGSLATLDLTSLPDSSLTVIISNAQAAASIELKRAAANWNFDGRILWQSNALQLSGFFAPTNWFPASAILETEELVIPPALLATAGLSDLRGTAAARWTHATYRFDLNLQGAFLETDAWRPEQLTLGLGGSGDLSSVRFEQLDFTSPQLQLALAAPLTFDYSGQIVGGSSELSVRADLGRIEAIPLTGLVEGQLRVTPTLQSPLMARFDVRGQNLSGLGLEAQTLDLAGSLNWPDLQITNLTAEFDSGAMLTASLDANVSTPQIRLLEWQFNGPWPGSLPGSVHIKAVNVAGTAQGTWPALDHHGSVSARGLLAGPLQAALARVAWKGRGFSFTNLDIQLASGSSTLELNGNGTLTTTEAMTQADVELQAVKLTTREGVWNLNQPVALSALQQTNGVGLTLSPMELNSTKGRMTLESVVNWPASGEGVFSLTGFRSADVQDFLIHSLPDFEISEARAQFTWNEGPLLFDAALDLGWHQEGDLLWSVNGRVQSDGQTLNIPALSVTCNEKNVATLSGGLPVRIQPSHPATLIVPDTTGVAHMDLRIGHEQALLSWLERKTGVRIIQPQLQLRGEGRLDELNAQIDVSATRLEWLNTNTVAESTVPALENFHAQAAINANEIFVGPVTATVLGQAVNAEGRWRLDSTGWMEWWRAIRSPSLDQLSGQLSIQHAELSALAGLLPKLLSPVGTADVTLELKPGLDLTGHVTLTNAATAPLPPLGVFRNIEVNLDINGRTVVLNQLTATLHGRPVSASGEGEWRPDGEIRFNLNVKGENLSLVHEADLFVRTDMNLQLSKGFENPTLLAGEIQLQRSLLFRDFRSLASLNLNQPLQRPPYFSIVTLPFADWRLDVRVKGDRFMQVISPALKAEVSAGLQLTGTLREPIAVGELTMDEGKILFPFGRLDLERGRVTLSREDPFRPRIEFRAQGLNFGYNITTDIRGPADTPNITLQSVPPLTSQQILLLLSAGEIPSSQFQYSTTDKASRVGFYVGKEFVNQFVGGSSTAERLQFRSGEYLTDDGSPTYSIEYRFTERWGIFGEYDRFQDFNSGLKYKLLSK